MIRLSLCARVFCGLGLLAGAPYLHADSAKPFDAAAAFGARTDVTSLRLSPDGSSVLFITPIAGQGSAVYTLSLAPGAKAKVAFYADGKPYRLQGCRWVTNDRLVCTVYGLTQDHNNLHRFLPVARMEAVDADGTKAQLLTTQLNQFSVGGPQYDIDVIDWMPEQSGSILMAKQYVPDNRQGILASHVRGLGVDLVDTRTLTVKHVLAPREDVGGYITDGRGTVRIAIVGDAHAQAGAVYATGQLVALYRMRGSEDWHRLSTFNSYDNSGFRPVAVDFEQNIAYGWKKLEGRMALYSMSLDESPTEKLVFSRPDVDVSGLIRMGRGDRVVGATYSTDVSHSEFFSDDVSQMMIALHKALPQQPLVDLVDTSADNSKVIVFAGSDVDPGNYYILDQKAHSLHKFLGTRAHLEGVKLAHVRTMSYPSGDGSSIPGYLTLPPGVDNPHGLPAIVMPHGGPYARDEWGFDWLAQFYAARGFVVLQPNFRGSAGYGDEWFEKNGFKAWDIAVGDVVAAGRWLVKEGIADPSKLAIVGWSYGGYAALQSVAIDQNLFKAIVAIAPVTDLAALKEEHRWWSDYALLSSYIGDGPHMVAGSPIKQSAKFTQPVLFFHGTNDINVSVEESKRMDSTLKSLGANSQLVVFEDHDHQLDDSAVRADMLRQSDVFLRHSLGMSP
jgi:dipeptidyl aminopeptidase/acylaminoacyl peptidase